MTVRVPDDLIADLAQASALVAGLVMERGLLGAANVDRLTEARRLIDETLVDCGRVFDVDVVV